MSNTDRYRVLAWTLWTVVVLTALGGWLIFDRDPSTLGPVLAWVTAATGIGEAANVGKRATYKREAVDP